MNDKMDDKFILMGLEDSRAGHVAEVLKNKTCKKILDFLAERKEASEKDIAKGLDMPINTTEYNLKKLIKAGLVDRTKNFFWSVKGKKIPMYKLARKHIIISPSKKPNLSYLKSILPAILIAVALIALIVSIFPQAGDEPGPIPSIPVSPVSEDVLKQFSSQQELTDFVKEASENRQISDYFIRFGRTMETTTAPQIAGTTASSETKAAADDYSTTNIQVEGVDEADIVKNDGKYIYVVSGKKAIIVDAYPAENMEILSEIELDKTVTEIFINEDKLVIFASGYSKSSVHIYDISDKEDPEEESVIETDGNYLNSRMIDDYVYVISNKYVNINNPEPPIYWVNGLERAVVAEDVSYWPYPDTSYVFTSIMAIDIDDGDFNSKVYLTGGTGTVYVSQDNIYLTQQKRMDYENYVEEIAEQVYFPLLPNTYEKEIKDILDSDKQAYLKLREMQEVVEDYASTLQGDDVEEFAEELQEELEEFSVDISKETEKTVIHKIKIRKKRIEYKGAGEVPGRVLNQFSMDEYRGKFRIATTTGNTWQETSLNHLYVLDEDLEIIGEIEDLAKGERIYSARFMGERAYLVTFRQVDPFYVLDLSDPEDPEVLGYLKIPGYSSYLHPYDEDRIIGLGKEGSNLKLSLFDVSDVEDPVEIDKYTIEGASYSDSNALYDHKAFLFDKERELLVIPVSYNEFIGMETNQYGYEYRKYRYSQGAFVFDIDENGFELKGEISHRRNVERDWMYRVERSLYMDDALYTISKKKIKANFLDDLDEIESIRLPYDNDYRTVVMSE
jgi:uncharacterized secreted protein with C-terminal beta-propeller domain